MAVGVFVFLFCLAIASSYLLYFYNQRKRARGNRFSCIQKYLDQESRRPFIRRDGDVIQESFICDQLVASTDTLIADERKSIVSSFGLSSKDAESLLSPLFFRAKLCFSGLQAQILLEQLSACIGQVGGRRSAILRVRAPQSSFFVGRHFESPQIRVFIDCWDDRADSIPRVLLISSDVLGTPMGSTLLDHAVRDGHGAALIASDAEQDVFTCFIKENVNRYKAEGRLAESRWADRFSIAPSPPTSARHQSIEGRRGRSSLSSFCARFDLSSVISPLTQ